MGLLQNPRGDASSDRGTALGAAAHEIQAALTGGTRGLSVKKRDRGAVLGVLKEQRAMRRFRLRGLAKVALDFTLAATALNLTRIWRVVPQLRIIA